MYTNDFYIQAFTSAKETIHTLMVNTDNQVFNTPPAEGKWCIGEIISHLIQTDKEYLTVLENKILGDTSDLKKGAGPYTHPIHLRWFIKIVSPEFKMAVPTLPPFEPKAIKDLDKSLLLEEFEVIQNRYLTLLEKAAEENLHLGKIKVGNPIYPFVKMSVSACLAVNEAHQRRHFQQIERILAQS